MATDELTPEQLKLMAGFRERRLANKAIEGNRNYRYMPRDRIGGIRQYWSKDITRAIRRGRR